MNQVIIAYVLYLIITTILTIWVAKTLFRNGKIFLYDIFHGNKELADSVNNLLLVGFYLINIGYAVYTLQITSGIGNAQDMFEKLSLKIGLIILILGFMHFMNLYIFFTLRKRAILHKPISKAD
ncbi:MAG: hypothetical protein JST02_00990 [Bacteroidetes bacterium]|nr:hypothetical protein [Bacteroidota bacterium]